MTQTFIHIIPYSKPYTGITQNNNTYIPSLYHHYSKHHQNSTNMKQASYKRLNVNHTTHGTPTGKKENRNSRGK
jgi:hypothetical protein